MMRKNRKYEGLTTSPVAVVFFQPVLAGSVTSMPILVQDVTVKDFENDPSFPEDGFEVDFD